MIFDLTFKTPDVLDQVEFQEPDPNDEEAPTIEEQRFDLKLALSKWLKYGENVTIRFNTTRMTATVVETGIQ